LTTLLFELAVHSGTSQIHGDVDLLDLRWRLGMSVNGSIQKAKIAISQALRAVTEGFAEMMRRHDVFEDMVSMRERD
jgi:hypothetical protein